MNKSPKFYRQLFVVFFALLVWSTVEGTVLAQNEFTKLEAAWKRHEYAQVLNDLIVYRQRTGHKTLGLDYMIATSACRTAGHRATGGEFFSWILYNYNLNGSNRSLVEREKQKCSSDVAPSSLQVAVPASLVGVIYSGKGGVGLKATSSGNAVARVVAPIPAETFESRLLVPSAWKIAEARVTTLLGSDRDVEHVGPFILVSPSKSKSADSSSSNHSSAGSTEILNRRALPNSAPSHDRKANSRNEIPAASQPADSTPANAPVANAPAGNAPAGNAPTGNAPNASNKPVHNKSKGIPSSGVNAPGINAQQPANQAVQEAAQGSSGDRHRSHSDEDFPLEAVGKDLEKYYRFFCSEYSMPKSTSLLTVYFARNIDELEHLSVKLHGIELAHGSLGYSFPGDQSMVGWADGKAYGTFVHELFHLMVRNGFGDIPPWMDEGMAALYEVSRFDNGRAVGVDNWRGKILRDLWTKRPHLKDLIRMSRGAFDAFDGRSERSTHLDSDEILFAGEVQAVNHATARYFMLYLQEQRQLQSLYVAFSRRAVSDQPEKQAVELVESVLHRSLDQVDEDFARWFKSIRR